MHFAIITTYGATFVDVWDKKKYNEIHFQLRNSTLYSTVEINNYIDNHFILENVTILGIEKRPSSVKVNGVSFNQYSYKETQQVG